jgi:ubiquinone/menaquinone biosynthesis C-methylase UbiE
MSVTDHDEIVRRSFAGQTHLFRGHQALFARRAHSPTAWVDPLEPDMIVLDVACGAGHAAEIAAPHVRQVIGVDLTPELIALGNERLTEAGVANVVLQEGNAAALPFADGSFDLVMCRSALHHMPDPRGAVAEMARVCRPGGRVVVADMVAESVEVRDRFDEVHRALDPSHAGCLVEAELAELLASTVGPVTYGETMDPLRAPIEHIFSESSDRSAVTGALDAELAGGPATGFDPVVEDGEVKVAFTITVVHAGKPAELPRP